MKIKSRDKGLNSLHTKFQQKILNGARVMICVRGAPFSLGHTVHIVHLEMVRDHE